MHAVVAADMVVAVGACRLTQTEACEVANDSTAATVMVMAVADMATVVTATVMVTAMAMVQATNLDITTMLGPWRMTCGVPDWENVRQSGITPGQPLPLRSLPLQKQRQNCLQRHKHSLCSSIL